MPRIIDGAYSSTQILTNPLTDNPTTVTSAGVVSVNSAYPFTTAISGTGNVDWTIDNFGTVASIGTKGLGIFLQAGGSVTNGQGDASTALISGGYDGIFARLNATVANYGTVKAPAFTFNGATQANDAVFLAGGGTVQNGMPGSTGAVIEGYHLGIVSASGTATINNFGTIKAIGTHCNDAGGASGPEAGVGILLGSPTSVIVNGASDARSAVIEGYYRAIAFGYEGSATIVNFGTIESTQTSLPVRYFGAAIILHNGGTITNYGEIKGAQNGVWTSVGKTTLGAPGTITNFGTIEETSGFAVINGRVLLPKAISLVDGGTVTNSGVIRAGWNGVELINVPGQVINSGTIESSAAKPGMAGLTSGAVILVAGGTVTNGAGGATGALIQGYQNGVYLGGENGTITPGAIGTVANYGTISVTGADSNGVLLAAGGTLLNSGTIGSAGTSGYGVRLGAAGSVTNGVGGLISSAHTGISVGNGAGTVNNFGTIKTGATVQGTGIELTGGGRITNAAGASITAAGNAVSLAGTAATTAAATVSNSGTITGEVGISIGAGDTGNNMIINYGTIAGTSGIAISLGGGNDRIVIEPGSSLQGALSNFNAGDSLDLAGLAFDANGSVVLQSGNLLHVSESGGTFDIALDPNEDFSGERFRLSADAAGGTLVTVAPKPAAVGPHDIDGDGKSDILLQNDNGMVAAWLMNGLTLASGGLIAAPPPSWHVSGLGDFDSDGKADILLQNDNGLLGIWLLNGLGLTGGTVITTPSADGQVVATGDLDGNGKSDILFRKSDGSTAIWLMNGLNLKQQAVIAPASSGHPIDTGDFNGDGKSDILMQQNDGSIAVWLMDGTTASQKGTIGTPAPSWHEIGTGDFDGDGKFDILWQHDNGAIEIWGVDGTGVTFEDIVGMPPPGWHAEGTADLNGDGKADILFQADNGATAAWLMNGTAVIEGGLVAAAPSGWHLTG